MRYKQAKLKDKDLRWRCAATLGEFHYDRDAG
jgi:hypothetical protein